MQRTLYALTLLALLASCRKEKDPTEVTPPPPQGTPVLAVTFGTGTISKALVDSVTADFDMKNGLVRRIVKLAADENSYKTALNTLPAGEWEVTLTVHTQKGGYDHPRRYVYKQHVTTPANASLENTAPNGTTDDKWKPRVVIRSSENNFTAILAVNPEDPYFEVVMDQARWTHVYLDRYVYHIANGTATPVAAQEFDKPFAGQVLAYANLHSFENFANGLRGKNWMLFETYLNLLDQDLRPYSIVYRYRK